MPFGLENTLVQSMREKVLPSLASSLVLALISPATKMVRAWRIAGKRQKLFSELDELNKESLTLKETEVDASDLNIAVIRGKVRERRECVIADLAKVELMLAGRRERGSLPLTGWRRLLLVFSPNGWKEWAQVVQYFAFSILTVQCLRSVFATATQTVDRWERVGYSLVQVALLVGYFAIAWYFNERAFYLREARLDRRPPKRFSRWLKFFSYACLGLLLINGLFIIASLVMLDYWSGADAEGRTFLIKTVLPLFALGTIGAAESLWVLFQVHRQSLFGGRFAESSAQPPQISARTE